MKSRGLWWAANIAVLMLGVSIGAVAQGPTHMRFTGLINDYTPQNVSGPWEVRGEWWLKVKGDSGTADFSAMVTMGRSDQGVILSGGGNLNDPTKRNAHTHHITLVDGVVTPLIPNGFRVTGTATVTGNGSYPPPFGPSSTLQIDVTGGNTVAFSNIKMTFTGDAVGHFGAQAINGVVRSSDRDDDRDDNDRR